MKKGIVIAFLIFLGVLQTQAQVTFKPGIRAGANFSHFSNRDRYDNYYSETNNDDFTSRTDFYVGFYGELKLTDHYRLQPEISYSNQGSNYKFTDPDTDVTTNRKLDVSYLSIIILNKFFFNDKFNFHFGPTLDFVVDSNFNTYSDVDLAFMLGAGYNFNSNFGIEARVKKGIIPVFDTGDNHTNVVFSVGGTYTFDVK